MKKVRYNLYAVKLSQDALAAAERERFYRAGPTHILVYRRTGKNRIPGAVAVKDAALLSPAEAAWLRECNMTLLQEFANAHVESNAGAMREFVSSFQEELKRERKKLNAGTGPAEKVGEDAS